VIFVSKTAIINYPPKEILDVERKDYEHIILWMLSNNEECEWSDFLDDPVNISQSTFSNYRNKLINKGYITNEERGKYQITREGEERFRQLSKSRKIERKLSYPPKTILRRRNYYHWILWICYNNNYCKWSDFQGDDNPIFINNSSLSKNLNFLQEDGLIKKENNKYIITNGGKIAYAEILKEYDLDRQSILDEERKRVKEITEKMSRFFERYKIDDNGVKFRLLYNILKLDYSKSENFIAEEDFNKILLYIAINHPDQFPNYISAEEFCQKFNIREEILNFFIMKIIDEKIFPIKFFKLEDDKGRIYYFQAGEKIERVLRAIVDDYITQFTYLHEFYDQTSGEPPILYISSIIDQVLNEICDHIFNGDMRQALKNFLPEYIKHLAYKIEKQRRLIETDDKLRGVAIQEFMNEFENLQINHSDKYYFLYPSILGILESFYISEENQIIQIQELIDHWELEEALEMTQRELKRDSENTNLIILKSILLCYLNRHKEAEKSLNDEIDEDNIYTNSQLALNRSFILTFIYINQGKFEKALELANNLLFNYSENSIAYLAKALVHGYNLIYEFEKEKSDINEDFLNVADKAITLETDNTNKALIHQLKSFVYQEFKRYKEALEEANKINNLEPKSLWLYFSKIKLLLKFEKNFKEVLKLTDELNKIFPDYEKMILQKKASFLYWMEEYDKSLKIINSLLEENPDDPKLLNSKLYELGKLKREEEALKIGKKLVQLAPKDGNYRDSYGEILLWFGKYEQAILEFQKAMELEPNGWFCYQTCIKMGDAYRAIKQYKNAIESYEKGLIHTKRCICDFENLDEWKERAMNSIEEVKGLMKET
jgi:tetratricopeptide (TPR) repeat protein/Mn-dependent DtxR family transcriptional regulator